MIIADATIVSLISLLLIILSTLTVFALAAKKSYDLTGVAIDFGRKRIDQAEKRFKSFQYKFYF